MNKKVSLGVALLGVFALVGCGGPSTYTNSELDVTLTLPSGWEASYVAPDEYTDESIDVKAGGLRAVLIENVTTSQFTETPDSLEMLTFAMESQGYTSDNAASTDNGFGGIYTKEGEDSLIYYVLNKNDNIIRCVNGAYYKEEHKEGAAQVCSTMK